MPEFPETLEGQVRLLMWMLRTLDCGDCNPQEVKDQRRKVEKLVGIFSDSRKLDVRR
jgi:hypothetical protein